MPELAPEDFGAYFKAIHGAAPFPWQARLLAEVAREGRWPGLLDLPTGTGKTAAIDVALFHLALDAALPPDQRRAPRRIVMVVDRRTVVDQAFKRAEVIASALRDAKDGVPAIVANRLRSLSRTDVPLALAQLRGGMPRDDGWARRPDQPLVAVSTVDQAGSRLLFRGYGVSEAMRPIHAGLLGNDTLFLLDEVHLSEPFRQTLEALREYRRWAKQALPDRWQVVEMSATPGKTSDFGLTDEDHRDDRLAKRLLASKPIETEEVKVSGAEAAKRAAFVDACAARVMPFATRGRTVGVIVNRVATARETFTAIRKRLGDRARVFLVTGRMRPLDRDALDAELGPLVRSGHHRDQGAHPLVVVSTQCIEAGADFDFDAIVAECASLDALRQRFGRLNRLGEIDDARGVVLVRSDALKADDPIYGAALRRTWEWLGPGLDFGNQAMAPALTKAEEIKDLFVCKGRAPVMLPAHLDLWAQTKPAPQPDPDVALWLHGVEQRQEPEVQVVWRADVTEALLGAGPHALDALIARLEVCPPVGLEALSLPIHAVRAWLLGDAAEDITDIDGAPHEEEEKPREGRRALLWKGDESHLVAPGEIPPGATIVVPATYGGIADRAWDPSSKASVADLGDLARWEQTRRPVLRLHAALVSSAWQAPPPARDGDPDADDRKAVMLWLADAGALPDVEPWRHAVFAALTKGRPPAIVRVAGLDRSTGDGEEPLEPAYLAVVGRGRASDASTEDDSASHTGVEITLRDHLRGVASWARRFADGCGLPPDVARDIELAGRWHDAGKVDPRFQRMLHGGSAYRAEVAREPLAKSAIVAADRAARARAQERSGYPKGARHELASVALLEAHAPLLAEATDRELVLYLVASHHGFCRPFAPVTDDVEAVDLTLEGAVVRDFRYRGLARLDAGIAERFWRLVERYGWFGLAWLEAIVRLADHRRSEEEQLRDAGAKEES